MKTHLQCNTYTNNHIWMHQDEHESRAEAFTALIEALTYSGFLFDSADSYRSLLRD